MTTRRKLAARIALGAVGVVAVVALALVVALRLERVQRAIGEAIVAALDDEVEGTIEVDEYVTIALSEVHVRGFRVRDSDGAIVLSVDDVTMVPDLRAILDRRVSCSSARASGGTLVFAQRAGGPLHLDHAFRSTPSPPGPEAPGEGFLVDLREIAFEGLRVELAAASAPGAVFEIESGMVSVATDARGVPSVRFRMADGLGRLAEPAISVGIASASGVFDGAAEERAVVTADARLDGNPVPIRMTLRDPGDDQLVIHVRADPSRGGIVGRFVLIALTAMSIDNDRFLVDVTEPGAPPT
jgi:hypothetical protein